VRKVQLVYSNPAPGLEDEFNEWYSSRHVHEILARFEEARIAGRITSSPALDPVFSGNFYEPIGEKVVQR
jgi:hypothetical protein